MMIVNLTSPGHCEPFICVKKLNGMIFKKIKSHNSTTTTKIVFTFFTCQNLPNSPDHVFLLSIETDAKKKFLALK